MKTTFKESQKVRQWWLWLILLVTTGVLVWLFISTKTTSTVSGLFFMALIVFLFLVLNLKTEINKDGISMIYFPFIKKQINWKDIKSTKVLDYGFVGGWGIRLWTKYGTVYNVRGSKGILIELKKGKKLVIGTQKEEELKLFLTELNE